MAEVKKNGESFVQFNPCKNPVKSTLCSEVVMRKTEEKLKQTAGEECFGQTRYPKSAQNIKIDACRLLERLRWRSDHAVHGRAGEYSFF